jgi:hypothetical protein
MTMEKLSLKEKIFYGSILNEKRVYWTVHCLSFIRETIN